MADSDSNRTPLSSSKKENLEPIGSRLTELSESRSELLTRIQGLKQDLQSWRSKLDTQVKVYREELTELKNSLNVEVDQLKSDFQELRTTLQQQQEEVTAKLGSLGLQDESAVAKQTPSGESGETDTNSQIAPSEEHDKENPHGATEGNSKKEQIASDENEKRPDTEV